jgi:hypothetical protein
LISAATKANLPWRLAAVARFPLLVSPQMPRPVAAGSALPSGAPRRRGSL